MIASTTLSINFKTTLQFFKIILYFCVYISFLACIWWWTLVGEGAPTRYGQDFDVNGYTSSENVTLMDENGEKVPLDEDVVF